MKPLGRAMLAIAAAAAAAAFFAAPASAVGFSVKTLHFDVVIGPADDEHCDIIGDLYKPDSATSGNPAPAILTTNGFGGSKDGQATFAKTAAARGYVVLSYSGLGFGGSGCKITLDDRDFDGKAASQLVTFLGGGKSAKDGTRVDYVQHDAVAHDGQRHAFDPRLGMIGGSYGGQIQFAVAAIDPRVDTIIPQITWNDLAYSLAPNNTSFDHGVTYQTPGIEKAEWTDLFFAEGIADGIEGASADPSRNVGCPNFDNRSCGSKLQMDATGAPNDATIMLARHASVGSYVQDIRIPTLLAQGQADTLFDLQEEIATYHALRAQGVPVKMIWQYWGHSDGTPAPGELKTDPTFARTYEGRVFMQWLDHYLAGAPALPPLDVTYFRDWVKYSGDATPAYARALSYPFGDRRLLYLSGSGSLVSDRGGVQAGSASFTTPAAGGPTSYTETSALDQRQPVTDAPGTFAEFTSQPLAADTDVIGVPTADVTISAPTFANATSATGAPGELVLFFKLYDLKPDGTIVLQHRLIAPVRIADLSHPVHVELPGIVHRFAAGDRVALTIAASDAAYKGNNAAGPVTISTDPANPGVLDLPVVPAAQQLPVAGPTGVAKAIRASRCTPRRKFVLRVHRRHGVKLRSASIYVGRKRVRTLRGRALRHQFHLRHLPQARFRLRVVIHGVRHGKHVTITDSRTYSACAHRRGGPHHHRRTHHH